MLAAQTRLAAAKSQDWDEVLELTTDLDAQFEQIRCLPTDPLVSQMHNNLKKRYIQTTLLYENETKALMQEHMKFIATVVNETTSEAPLVFSYGAH